MSPWQMLGVTVALLVLAFALFNGILMALSPKRWFRLPRYARFTWHAYRFEPTIMVHVQVRILGAILAALSGWMCVELVRDLLRYP
ncbi:MAG TPA: hypothetical protein VFO34_05605 [Candidatus Acidoferrales bacterium]|nr:hypothetical protein [Candidatus Acidoferrales bacterium]